MKPPPIDPEDLSLSPEQLDDKYNPEGDGEHPCYPRADWRYEVANGDTISGYWDWLYNQLQNHDIEELA